MKTFKIVLRLLASSIVGFGMIAQHVARVLAQVALDALAEFLHAVYVFLHHPMLAVGLAGAGFEGGNLLVLRIIPRHIRHQVFDDGEGFEEEL